MSGLLKIRDEIMDYILNKSIYSIDARAKAGAQGRLEKVLARWMEPHRFYHNIEHLKKLLDKIAFAEVSEEERYILDMAAIFHDAVYDPRATDNEEQSAQLAHEALKDHLDVDNYVKEIILDTKAHHKAVATLSQRFCKYDVDALLNPSWPNLVQDEMKLFREFQAASIPDFISRREKFLNWFCDSWTLSDDRREVFKSLAEWRQNRRWKIGIYPGSFNPFHVGHMDVLEQAEKIFDKVIVAVGINPDKVAPKALHSFVPDALFPDEKNDIWRLPYIPENIHTLHHCVTNVRTYLPFHEIVLFRCTLAKLIREYSQYADVSVIRGLRSGLDLESEMSLARTLQDMEPSAKIVYVPCARDLSHVSSSMIRGLQQFGREEGLTDRYFPKKYAYAQDKFWWMK
jgi:pantetheine-phosphate adenylyltransferase